MDETKRIELATKLNVAQSQIQRRLDAIGGAVRSFTVPELEALNENLRSVELELRGLSDEPAMTCSLCGGGITSCVGCVPAFRDRIRWPHNEFGDCCLPLIHTEGVLELLNEPLGSQK